MTDYFEFLQEASEDRKLQIFREEANARVAERPIPEDKSTRISERSEDEEDKKGSTTTTGTTPFQQNVEGYDWKSQSQICL